MGDHNKSRTEKKKRKKWKPHENNIFREFFVDPLEETADLDSKLEECAQKTGRDIEDVRVGLPILHRPSLICTSLSVSH